MKIARAPQWVTTLGLLGALAAYTLAACTLTACTGDKGTAPAIRPAATTLGSARVSPYNAVMAVGDTLTLVVTGRTLSGAPLAGFDSVQYILQDPTDSLRVHLSATGVVTAVTPSGTNAPVFVQVIAFKDGLARADQSIIQIVPTAFAGATLSIQPVPPDSAKMAWGDSKTITPAIQNTSGQSVDQPMVRYEYGPGDSTTMQCYVPNLVATGTLTQAQLQLTGCGTNNNAGQVGLNNIHAFKTGTAWVHANVMVFGVMLRDSVQYTLTNPYSGFIYASTYYLAGNQPGISSIYIAPGGTVTFYNGFPEALGISVGFTFNDPSAATAATPVPDFGGTTGNVTPLTTSQAQSTRQFLTPGVYEWTATLYGGVPPYTGATWSGSITVQ